MAGELNAMPSLAALGDRVVLVWTGTRDGVMSVYSAVSDDRGATFNIQRRVNDRPGDVAANVEQPPRVAISSAGIAVVWSSKLSGTSAIRMSRSTDGGRSFSPATTINDSSLTGVRLSSANQEEAAHPQMAVRQDGTVAVVWDEPHGDTRQVLMRTAPPGRPFGPATVLNAMHSGDHPVIAPVADGLLVAWTSAGSTGSFIELQRIGVSPLQAKPVQNREYQFRGRVEQVDAAAGTLTVNGENVEGWMGPMTMMYKVDDKDVLGRLKPGDRITAIVRTADFQHLYEVATAR
jgi:Cu/Ag efflux protein CusF